MENMENGLTVPKWVLRVWPKIPQKPQNLSAQFVCLSPKVLDFNERRLYWVSVVSVFRGIVSLLNLRGLIFYNRWFISSSECPIFRGGGAKALLAPPPSIGAPLTTPLISL